MALKRRFFRLNSPALFPSQQKAPALALRPERPENRSELLAKRQAAEQDVLLREVDDALRQDEMSGAFKRFGLPIAIGLVIGLVALGGYLWWDSSRKAQTAEHGEQLTLALDKIEGRQLGDGDKALAVLTGEAKDGSAAAAGLMRGGVALEQNKPAEAAKQFAAVAADADAPQPFRDLATIREVAVRFDALPPQQVVDRLKTLAVPGNPWFGNAGELVGIAYLKQNKPELAGPLFAAIAKDKTVSESLRGRARQLAGLLGADAIDDVAKAPAPAPAAE